MSNMIFDYPFQNLNNMELNSLYKPDLLSQNITNTFSSCSGSKYNYSEPSSIKNNDNQNKLSILAVNIRSLNANFHKLELLLTELSFDPTIILVSETWISDSKPFIFSLKNYSFINQSGIGKGGGAGIFIKNNS